MIDLGSDLRGRLIVTYVPTIPTANRKALDDTPTAKTQGARAVPLNIGFGQLFASLFEPHVFRRMKKVTGTKTQSRTPSAPQQDVEIFEPEQDSIALLAATHTVNAVNRKE